MNSRLLTIGVHISFAIMLFVYNAHAQCPPFPSITLTTINDKIIIDDFQEMEGGASINALYINVNAPAAACTWDLYLDAANLTSVLYTSSATQGAVLSLSDINIRAKNFCETAGQGYPVPPPCVADPTRICDVYNNPIIAGGDHYIVGTAGVDGLLADNQGACLGADNINDNSNSTTTPQTHRFRVDLQVIPGMATVTTPGFYTLDLDFAIIDDAAAPGPPTILTYTVTIDIQPILQIKMSTESQIDFVFSDMKKYVAGITKYAATILNVSSNMNWDLIAVGTSILNESTGGGSPLWDNVASYSSGGSPNIPLDALELHQLPANPQGSGVGLDYTPAFVVPSGGNNNVEVAFQAGLVPTFVAPSIGAKTIAGDFGVAGTFMGPGSYTPDVTPPLAEWDNAEFRYTIDYKLTPGLPALFVNGNPAMPAYARPGAYTMQVRYLLYEDQ